MNTNSSNDIIIFQPLSLTVYTVVGLVVTVCVCAFLYFGHYTHKQRVSGILSPDKGLIKIYSREPGTVETLKVTEGQHVNQGDLLYTLNSDRVSEQRESVRLEVKQRILSQLESLKQEESRQISLNAEAESAAEVRLVGIRREQGNLRQSEKLLSEQIRILDETVSQYQVLAQKGLVSKVRLQEEKVRALDRRSDKERLEREQVILEQRITVADQELASLKLQGQNQLASIRRNIEDFQQKLLEADPEREVQVTAPASGVVTGILVAPGQKSSSGMPVLSLLPEGSALQAELYVPSDSIGFIKSGSEVSLRYRAFPYQKFGQHRGQVKYISRAAMSVSEINNVVVESLSPSIPVYRVIVELPQQHIIAYGNQEPLQAGMEVEADILLDKRRLYEWMFEPLFSITG